MLEKKKRSQSKLILKVLTPTSGVLPGQIVIINILLDANADWKLEKYPIYIPHSQKYGSKKLDISLRIMDKVCMLITMETVEGEYAVYRSETSI